MNLGLVATLVAIVLFMSQARGDAIVTDSTSNSVVQSKSDSTTTVKSPPPSAIAPSFGGMNSDLCTDGISDYSISINKDFKDGAMNIQVQRLVSDFANDTSIKAGFKFKF